jgi:hypothetical protein
MNTNYKDSRAVIICRHIALEGFPILSGSRTEPLEPEDSGWQFLCCSGKEEKEDEAQVWLVKEVVSLEPSLSALINLPVGTKLHRPNKNSKWEKK